MFTLEILFAFAIASTKLSLPANLCEIFDKVSPASTVYVSEACASVAPIAKPAPAANTVLKRNVFPNFIM